MMRLDAIREDGTHVRIIELFREMVNGRMVTMAVVVDRHTGFIKTIDTNELKVRLT